MKKSVAIIGGGPAGLMAAEVISKQGVKVDVGGQGWLEYYTFGTLRKICLPLWGTPREYRTSAERFWTAGVT